MGRGDASANIANVSSRNSVNTISIVEKLRELKLGEAYEVGGCVRDELMGRECDDIDVAVVGITYDELVAELKGKGRTSLLEVSGQKVGVRFHSNWTGPEGIEIALARAEVSTGPLHTDFEIRPDPSITIVEDLERRDFTCNAIARNIETGEIYDPFNGTEDIENGILRTVSPDSFRDDPLRILRGLARCSKDGITPDAETAQQMTKWSKKLDPSLTNGDGKAHLAAERFYKELNKIFDGEHAAHALQIARDSGVFSEVFPELQPIVGFDQRSKYHDMTVDEHTFAVVDHACKHGASRAVRWAALLHDAGKPEGSFLGSDGQLHFYRDPDNPDSKAHEEVSTEIVDRVMSRLRADNATANAVRLLVAEHMFSDSDNWERRSASKRGYKARSFIKRVGRENVEDLLMLRRCDRAGKRPGELPDGWDRELAMFENDVRAHMNDPVDVKELAINGYDLIELGYKGKQIADVQKELLQRVLADPALNTRDRLLGWAEKLAPAGTV